jgi:hypothetical protein
MIESRNRGGNSGGTGDTNNIRIDSNEFGDSWNQSIKLDGVNGAIITRNNFVGSSTKVVDIPNSTGIAFYSDNTVGGGYGSAGMSITPGSGPGSATDVGEETGGVLPVARQLAGWVIAADLVGYRPTAFTNWVSEIRTRFIGGHGAWDVLKTTSQVTANNWGAHSLAARVACSAYLGDTTDLAECANIFRRYTGESRAAWTSWVNTDDHDESWVDSQPMAGINGPAAASTKAGAVVEDICRGPSHPNVDEVGLSYSWEALQGAVLTAKLLSRAGYGDCFGWGGNALLRAAQFINSKAPSFAAPPYAAYPPRHSESQWVPYAINRRYDVNLAPLGSATDRGWAVAAAHWIF